MEFSRAEDYLLQIPMWTKTKNSLADVREFVKRLGNPDSAMKIIHVAGTNGKGSVCAYLTAMLQASGFGVCTFVSPHLVEIRERFLINGIMVEETIFEDGFRKVKQVTDQMLTEGFMHPTFFEFLFLMCLVIFKDCALDYVVLETGMGGRLDTTNVCTPVATILTSVSMDHVDFLGDTLEAIAREKAGIIKPRIPVIYDDHSSEVSAVIRCVAEQKNAPVYPIAPSDYEILTENETGITVKTVTYSGDLLMLEISSPARYQAMNALLAFRAIEVVLGQEISFPKLLKGAKAMHWAGRMELISSDIYLDGAHNVGGIEAFMDAAKHLSEQTGKTIGLLFAAVSDKEYEKMIELLGRNLPLRWVVVAHIGNKRGMDSEALVQVFKENVSCPVTGFPDVKQAIAYAMSQKTQEDLLFCVGSLYLIGEIKEVLGRKEHD